MVFRTVLFLHWFSISWIPSKRHKQLLKQIAYFYLLLQCTSNYLQCVYCIRISQYVRLNFCLYSLLYLLWCTIITTSLIYKILGFRGRGGAKIYFRARKFLLQAVPVLVTWRSTFIYYTTEINMFERMHKFAKRSAFCSFWKHRKRSKCCMSK